MAGYTAKSLRRQGYEALATELSRVYSAVTGATASRCFQN